MKDGWIGVDLDGTLAHYDGWKNELHIGPPVPKMLARVKAWLAEGEDVRIFTARVSVGNRDLRESIETAIEAWCQDHIGRSLPITCRKDFDMVELWDDRAVSVVENTGETDSGTIIKAAKAVEFMANLMAEHGLDFRVPVRYLFKVGDQVTKNAGDYTFTGHITARFIKRGKPNAIRYAVENADGIVHIFNQMQLVLTEQMEGEKT